MLDESDLILAPRNITSVPGEGEIVAVSGHTASAWRPWLFGGLGVIVVLAAFGVARHRTARRRDPDAN
ncbi:hypothetical protein [Pseudonocardia acaciae]|uniref:hypothetical protein n=1 Tax=Pseudonocardia acaciae TaxID=551276 RepID=UPI000490EEE4|nr:hypothetical protein [Pseudonocardia acaciae]